MAVADGRGRYVGILTVRGVTDTLADGEHDDAPAGSAAEQVASIRGDQVLDSALDVLESAGAPAIPVLDPAGTDVIGWLTHQRILAVIRDQTATT